MSWCGSIWIHFVQDSPCLLYLDICLLLQVLLEASLVAQMVKRLLAMWETWVRSLGWEDPLEKEMATHFSILAWKITWMEEPGMLQYMGSQRVRHDWVTSLSLRFRKFSAIISSNRFSTPFSLTSPPGAPIIWILVYLMMSKRPLKLFSFSEFVFLFPVWLFCPLNSAINSV